MAESIEALIRRVAQEEGVDPALALAMARQESSLNPNAHNPNGEDSWGLFQLNRKGGMGFGYKPEQLVDPEFNARIALKSLARVAKERPSLDPGALAAASQRPADPRGYAKSVNAMLSGGAGSAHAGSPFSPGGSPVASPLAETLTAELAQLDADRKIAESNAKSQREAAATLRQRLPQTTEDNVLEVDDLRKDIDRREKEADKFDAEATRIGTQISSKKIDLAKTQAEPKAPSPKSQVQNFGSTKNPDWRRFNADTEEWEPMPNAPTGEPEDPSVIAQRGASTAAQLAQAGYTQVLTQKAVQDLLEAQQAQQIKDQLGEMLKQAQSGDPAQRSAAIQQIGELQAVLTDKDTLLRHLQTEATARAAQWKELQDSTGQVHDPLTLQPVLDDTTGKPKLTPAAQRLMDQTAAQNRATDVDEKRLTLDEKRLAGDDLTRAETGRHNAATETQTAEQNISGRHLSLATLEADRQKNYAQAQGDFEQFGVATTGRLAGLNRMSQGVDDQLAAGILSGKYGVDPNSTRGKAVIAALQQMGQFQTSGTAQTTQQPKPQQNVTSAATTTAQPAQPIAAIAQGMGPQAADLSQIGAPGWGQQYDPSTGQAQGDPYDIPEEGEQAAPAGPAPEPNSITKLIRSLGRAPVAA